MEIVLQIIVMGVIATALIDVWAVVLGSGFGLPVTNWAMVGRWFAHLFRGKVIHRPIAGSREMCFEHALGWGLHYAIGIAYSLLYLLLCANLIQVEPTVFSAIVFGFTTVMIPWLILQPGMGLGVFARLADKPVTIRLISLSIHILFGVGMYFGWLVSKALLL